MTLPWTYHPPCDLVAQVEAAIAAPGPGVVLVGGRGSGKTALVDHLLDRAATRRRATERISGSAGGASVALGAVVHLLPDLPPGTATVEVLRLALAALADRTGRRGPVLVGVDDAHLLDPASTDLLARAVTEGSAVVVATEPSESYPPAPRRSPPAPGATVLTVPDLGPDDVTALATAALGGAVDGALASALWTYSRGVPLLVRELLTGAHEQGRLHRTGGRWHLAGRLAHSDRVVSAVERQLSALTPAGRRALELVALAEPVDVATARQVAGAEGLTELEDHHLVVVARSGRRTALRCTNPAAAEVVRSTLPPLRRHLHLDALATTTASYGLRRLPDELRVARWRTDVGGPVPSRGLGLAALQAVAAGDDGTALRLRARAGDDPSFYMLLAEGLACSLAGDGPALGPARATASSPEEETHALAAELSVLGLVAGRMDDGHARLATTIAAAERADDPAARSRRRALDALRAQFLLLDDRVAEAGAEARRVLADAETRPNARARALAVSGLVAALDGDGAGARERLVRSLASAEVRSPGAPAPSAACPTPPSWWRCTTPGP